MLFKLYIFHMVISFFLLICSEFVWRSPPIVNCASHIPADYKQIYFQIRHHSHFILLGFYSSSILQ